jgi:hypothetical protein
MEQTKKIYLGSGKKRKPEWLTAAVCLSDAEKHSYEYNGKTYVNVNINVYDKVNEYGKDVSITLNDYNPSADQSSKV